ncbi:glycosyltransferase [Pseudaminobacter soli (ex Li et al. 2025)]|uniref:Glycosyltransferase family 1 protein n=1 Tax=Pseudaminobacter soli (ex Li et al. 2025) TaxID=1295366 RepID=A0A2P7SGA2_9HYPH|nr:glycosyltransferase [Mesorhizobium soli]PSJ61522.1 hypothetical protein C7I85_10760 [Mesorhizobium soli]
MMNILVLTNFWPTASNSISGIFVPQQIAALCRAGCQVTVLVGATLGKRKERHLSPQELGLPAEEVTLVKVPLLRLPEALSANRLAYRFNLRSTGLSVSRTMASLVRKTGTPQGCIVHGLRHYASSAPYWCGRLRARKIACVHGVDPFLARPSVVGYLKADLQRAQHCLDKIILVGSPLRRHATELGINISKTVVIPNGTEMPALSELPLNIVAGEGILKIASVSNLIALKGIDDNIRALRLLKEQYGIAHWQYSVIGDGPERQRLEALAWALGLSNHIRFLGRLPYDETMHEIARADIISLPSWGEAFGIVYLEAMARMKPTIGCHENGAADIIADGDDGVLVPPKDPDSLALALKRLIENPGLRERLGREARRTAERFSWDANVRCVLELLGLQSSSSQDWAV